MSQKVFSLGDAVTVDPTHPICPCAVGIVLRVVDISDSSHEYGTIPAVEVAVCSERTPRIGWFYDHELKLLPL